MAYRRKQGITRSSTFKEEIYNQPPVGDHYDSKDKSSNAQLSSFVAARAISSSGARNSGKFGGGSRSFSSSSLSSCHDESELLYQPSLSVEKGSRTASEDPRLKKGFDMMTTSLSHIGRTTTGNYASSERRHVTEGQKTDDIVSSSGTRKLQIRRKEESNNNWTSDGPWQPLHPKESSSGNQETQLKVSRDVAMATAAKAKVLLRELKTVKADLAFAKERCAQLEEENKRLRENRDKGNNHDDDDLIRLQLESLLAEKARLAHENSVYARENRFLREIVEYHQLSMQDLVQLDDAAAATGEQVVVPEMYLEPTSPFSPTSSLPQIFSSASCPHLVNHNHNTNEVESYDDHEFEFNSKDDSVEDNNNINTNTNINTQTSSSVPQFSVTSTN